MKQRELAMETALMLVETWLMDLRDYCLVTKEYPASKEDMLVIVRDALQPVTCECHGVDVCPSQPVQEQPQLTQEKKTVKKPRHPYFAAHPVIGKPEKGEK